MRKEKKYTTVQDIFPLQKNYTIFFIFPITLFSTKTE